MRVACEGAPPLALPFLGGKAGALHQGLLLLDDKVVSHGCL